MKPAREHATHNSQTYFVTSETWGRRAFFRAEPWARLFFNTLLAQRGKAYLLHEFVLMPKPRGGDAACGTTEIVPFRNESAGFGTAEAVPFQSPNAQVHKRQGNL